MIVCTVHHKTCANRKVQILLGVAYITNRLIIKVLGPSDLFGQSERHRLGKKEEMQDTLRARTRERTDLRYDRTS